MSYDIANAPKNRLSKKEEANKYYIENYSVDLTNKNSSHTIMVDEAKGLKRILDVGCGAGVIGKKIKELQKCTVDGIEIDTVAADIAKKVLDHVYVMPIDDEKNKTYQAFMREDKKYDMIICADIIEHLVDPGKTLSNLSKKLAPKGKIVISIPNLSHIDVIAGLIDGRFNYNRVGILDSTHLRFWTENSFYEFIANVNENYKINFVPRLVAKTTATDETIHTGFLEDVCGKELYTFQNVFELTVQKNPYVPKVRHYHNYEKLLQMGEELKNLREEVKLKNQIIKDMQQSTSWKVTAPLRKVSGKLKHEK
ncbi:class I SAM-dependent methyltransferase [Candidatus Saccharibacteria bacterium]|nr:class I SAM-dependent methyltransferase [Candidatus Saccharibacteria bacterium]MBR2710726.1 class I SAM-dependent methyltransferase [Candidatus Saccharibacteria bacterium]